MRPFSMCVLGWLLLLAGSVCAAASGPVYVVTRGDQPASYLVGTMHSEDPRVLALMQGFAPLIDRVDTVVVELVPDAVTMLAVGAAAMLPADRRLRDLVGERRYALVEDAAGRAGLPVAVIDRLKPWAAAVTLGMPASQTGRVLDTEVYLRALQAGRPVIGLETAAEQIAVFDALSLEAQVALLDEMMDKLPELPLQLERLTSAYLEGDLQRLDAIARAQFDDMPGPLVALMDTRLVVDRNRRMLARMAPLIAERSLFVAVGALHLVGDSGLVAGLRSLGFRVERLAD